MHLPLTQVSLAEQVHDFEDEPHPDCRATPHTAISKSARGRGARGISNAGIWEALMPRPPSRAARAARALAVREGPAAREASPSSPFPQAAPSPKELSPGKIDARLSRQPRRRRRALGVTASSMLRARGPSGTESRAGLIMTVLFSMPIGDLSSRPFYDSIRKPRDAVHNSALPVRVWPGLHPAKRGRPPFLWSFLGANEAICRCRADQIA